MTAGPVHQETPFEPQRGGIKAARLYTAPTELTPAWGRRGGHKDIAPTELGGGVPVLEELTRARRSVRHRIESQGGWLGAAPAERYA